MNNTKDKKFIVYMHVNKKNNKKYIGITSQSIKKRWRKNGEGYKSSPYFYNAIQKYGWNAFKHIILFENLTVDEAKQKEIELISKYKSNEHDYGYNCTAGGDSVSEYIQTKECREKISKKIKGRKLSEEHKLHIKESLIGRKFTEEWKQKISESHFSGNNPIAKKIVHIDKYYNLIKVYDCARDAERELNVFTSKILDVCYGRSKHTGGLFFMFYEDYINNKDSFIGKTIEIKPYRRRVRQKDLNDNIIAEYDMVKDAANAVGMYSNAISDCCKGRRETAAGYKWEYI